MASNVGRMLGLSGVSGLTGRVGACCPVTVGVVICVALGVVCCYAVVLLHFVFAWSRCSMVLVFLAVFMMIVKSIDVDDEKGTSLIVSSLD